MPLPLYVGSSRLAHRAAAKSVVVLPPSPRGQGRRLPTYPAGDPATTPAERLGLVGIVVAAGMDHQGTPPDGAQVLDARGGQLLPGGTVGLDREDRQVAEMAVTLRS